MVHTCNRYNKPFKKLWMLTHHLQDRKFPCRSQLIPTTNLTPVPQIELDTSRPEGEYISQEKFEYLKALGLIKNDANIHFNQIRVSDPKRPHDNFNLLSNWEAIVPSIKNQRYAFIKPISDYKEYNETPYMPQLLANARDEITRV